MYFYIKDIYVDYVTKQPVTTDNTQPVFCWSAIHEQDGQAQMAYYITVTGRQGVVWESGEVKTSQQRAVYGGSPLENGERYRVNLVITDREGRKSEEKVQTFTFFKKRDFRAKWIKGTGLDEDNAVYFTKVFSLAEPPVKAVLYCCGLGYQCPVVNGVAVEDSYLNPAVSNYNNHCYYTINDVTDYVHIGSNTLSVTVGNGWRNGEYIGWGAFDRDIPFFGNKQLIAELEIQYGDGRKELVGTDETWCAEEGPIRKNGVYFGETYDARFHGTNKSEKHAVSEAFGNTGELRPQVIQPVRAQQEYSPKVIRKFADNTFVLDFGTNIAGICMLKLPKDLKEGMVITLEHAEELLPDGDVDKETIRAAKATDTYIAGKENPAVWKPVFTYHGFRYVKVTGWPESMEENDIKAIAFYNDVNNSSYF